MCHAVGIPEVSPHHLLRPTRFWSRLATDLRSQTLDSCGRSKCLVYKPTPTKYFSSMANDCIFLRILPDLIEYVGSAQNRTEYLWISYAESSLKCDAEMPLKDPLQDPLKDPSSPFKLHYRDPLKDPLQDPLNHRHGSAESSLKVVILVFRVILVISAISSQPEVEETYVLCKPNLQRPSPLSQQS